MNDSSGNSHVFLINNPVVAIVAAIYQREHLDDPDKIINISIRDTKLNLLLGRKIYLGHGLLSRATKKLLGTNVAIEVLKIIFGMKNINFNLYGAWSYFEFEALSRSPRCKSFYYLEEGRQSYFNSSVFDKDNRELTFAKREAKIRTGDINQFWANGASKYIMLTESCFPFVKLEKKIIVEDVEKLRSLYDAKLIGKTTIAILPSLERLHRSHINIAIKTLATRFPEIDAIKPHPSYFVKREYIDVLTEAVSSHLDNVYVCDAGTVIEAEMLFEEKTLVGPLSSLEIYAKLLGSKYIKIDFENYVEPQY